MTQNECEKLMCEKIREMWEIYRSYAKTTTRNNYLNIAIIDSDIYVNNRYWKEDEANPIRILGDYSV